MARVEIDRDVDLVEHHDRRHAAVKCEHEVALDAPEVQVVVEAGHQEGGVHVGGQHLGPSVGEPLTDERARFEAGLRAALPARGLSDTGSRASQSPTAGRSTRDATPAGEAPLDDDLAWVRPQ